MASLLLFGCGGNGTTGSNANQPENLIPLRKIGEVATFEGVTVYRIGGDVVDTDTFIREVEIVPYTYKGRQVMAYQISTRTNQGTPVVVFDVFTQDPRTREVTSLAIINLQGEEQLHDSVTPGYWDIGARWTSDSGLFDIPGKTNYEVVGKSVAFTKGGTYPTWVVKTSEEEPAFVSEGAFQFAPRIGWYVESRGEYEADVEAGFLEIDTFGEMTSYQPAP